MVAKGAARNREENMISASQMSAGWLCIFCLHTWDEDDDDHEDPNLTIVLEVNHQ